MATILTDAEYAALAEFRFSLRQFLAFSEKKATECGVTPQQYQALLAIRAAAAGTSTVGYVAERLVLKPHSATGLVDRLETLGLVQRGASRQDRRQAVLDLTERAHEMLALLATTHREELVRLRPLLIERLENLDKF